MSKPRITIQISSRALRRFASTMKDHGISIDEADLPRALGVYIESFLEEDAFTEDVAAALDNASPEELLPGIAFELAEEEEDA